MRDRTLYRLTAAAVSATALILAVGCHPKPPVTRGGGNLAAEPITKPPLSEFESDPQVMAYREQIKSTQAALEAAMVKPPAATEPAASQPADTQPDTTQPDITTRPDATTEAAIQTFADNARVAALQGQLAQLNTQLDARLAELKQQKAMESQREAEQKAAEEARANSMSATTMPATTQPSTEPTTEAATEPTTLPTTNPIYVPTTIPTTAPTTGPTTMPTSQPAVADEAPPTDPNQIDADKALAPLFEGFASLTFTGNTPVNDPGICRLVAADLSAALTLDPSQSRFARLQAEAYRNCGDIDGEVAALAVAYQIDPHDEYSWIRRLDLTLASDKFRDDLAARAEYLQRIVTSPRIPANVQAYISYQLALTLLARGQDSAADATIQQGLRLNPVSFDLLRLKLDRLPDDATKYERLRIQLDLLRANPLQPKVSLQVADLIAQAGLARESIEFYKLTDDTLTRMGVEDNVIRADWAAELFIMDQTPEAIKRNADVLKSNPSLTPALFLQLVMTRADKAQYAKSYDQAATAFSNRVIEAFNKTGTGQAATTRPIDVGGVIALPDLVPAANKLKTSNDLQARQQFVEAVSDLALLKVYFGNTPEEGTPLVDALAAILPDGSPEVVRLRGWIQLRAGKKEDALATLTSVAKVDPIAAMGLVKLLSEDPNQRIDAEKAARKLIQDHPAGVVGAILKEGMENERVRLIPPNESTAIAELANTFPHTWTSLAASPENFFTVSVRPISRGVPFGDPLLANVTIANATDQPLTVGPEGVVKPDLLFKMVVNLPNVPPIGSFDRYAGPVVVPHGSSVTQVVRLDQTQLLNALNSIAGVSFFNVNGTVYVNQQSLAPQSTDFTDTFVRPSSLKVPSEVTETINLINSGRPADKISALSLARMYYLEDKKLLEGRNPPASISGEAADLRDAIHHARADPLQAVSAWAGLCESSLLEPGERDALIQDLAEDPDWRHRQSALVLVDTASPAVAIRVLKQLEWDKQSSVRATAQTLLPLLQFALARPRSTTRPTTAPTAEPTTMPAAMPTSMPTTAPTTMPAGTR